MEAKTQTPPPKLNLGPLKTPTQIRGALKRIGQRVLDGNLDPRRANCAIFAVSGAAKMLELEMSAEMMREAQRLNAQPAQHALEHESTTLDAELFVPEAM